MKKKKIIKFTLLAIVVGTFYLTFKALSLIGGCFLWSSE
jgi:hypothetical protein